MYEININQWIKVIYEERLIFHDFMDVVVKIYLMY